MSLTPRTGRVSFPVRLRFNLRATMDSEFQLIDEIRRATDLPEGVSVGIGDDTAVLTDAFELLTTDMLVEGVHFRFDLCSVEDVGWRALVASLSDIAAMGGEPGPYVASVCIGGGDDGRARELVDGMRAAAEAVGRVDRVAPIGGDLSDSPGPVVISIALLGTLAGDRPMLRRGAGPGDRIVLIGRPGRTMAGLEVLDGRVDDLEPEARESLADAYRRPTARVAAGAAIGEGGLAAAMVDVSDGLAADLGHLTEASEVGARVELERLPISADLARFAEDGGWDARRFAAGAGEDFCLLAAVPEERFAAFEAAADAADWPWAVIGAIVPPESGLEFVDAAGDAVELASGGYEHFDDGR